MNQWPPVDVCLAVARLHYTLEASWNGEYVTGDEIMEAFDAVKAKLLYMPPRPEHLSKGRALLGPKMPEDCAAICALKGERPDETK